VSITSLTSLSAKQISALSTTELQSLAATDFSQILATQIAALTATTTSAQTNARMADAATMYKGHYNEFMDRARKQSNPDVMNYIYQQAGDPAQAMKMGVKGGAQ